MMRARQIGLGVAVGAICTGAIVVGFDVERSARNLGVVAAICVALAVALVELFSDPSYGGPR
jgi:hypothetical protein